MTIEELTELREHAAMGDLIGRETDVVQAITEHINLLIFLEDERSAEVGE